jgi:hypothetical protein
MYPVHGARVAAAADPVGRPYGRKPGGRHVPWASCGIPRITHTVGPGPHNY